MTSIKSNLITLKLAIITSIVVMASPAQAQQVSREDLATPTVDTSLVSLFLEASFVVFKLPPYFENFGKRSIKSPKYYFSDTGLLAYLLDIEKATQVARDPLVGGLFENLVILEALKTRHNQGLTPNLYFYRDNHGREVDFLIPSAGSFALIECKWAESPKPTQRGFLELESLVGTDRIVSETIVTPDRGLRRASEKVAIADSVALEFLNSP